MAEKRQTEQKDENRDPLTGAPGSHPVGTGIGAAAAGAAAGAAGGAIAGPAGAAVGAIVGGVAGGYAGKAAAEAIDPTAEEAYWRENYSKREYYSEDVPYDTYAPAYQYGWESRSHFPDRDFDEVEPELREGWNERRGDTGIAWEQARPASRDAWDRISQPRDQRADASEVEDEFDRQCAVDPDDERARQRDRDEYLAD